MFERRLRLFLFVVFLGGVILAARAAQVQVVQRDAWSDLAASNAERINYLTPQRGDILDVKNRVLATDVPAFEACVNFRAIGPDETWLLGEARRRARKLDAWKAAAGDAARDALVERERGAIRVELDHLWDTLARVSGQTRGQIDDVRQRIADEVGEKHAAYWKQLYARATDEFANAPPTPWYERWIAGRRTPPVAETFQDKLIGEQLAFHPIVSDVNQGVYNELKFAQDEVPQFKGESGAYRSVLDLRPAVRRRYPFGDVACHVIGRVGQVSREDREADPNKGDPLRQYALIDRIGREGIEKLAEPQLRGDRGARTTDRRGDHLRTDESKAGDAVRTTIDIALQREIQDAFASVDFVGPTGPEDKVHHTIKDKIQLPMNGAAVVIDVATGEVRALVSVPTYDLNRYDELYPALIADDLNQPMRDRALMNAIEPGSTAKPIIGLGAVTQGLASASDTIECRGAPIIGGKMIGKPRCWTVSMFPKPGFTHHSIPSADPHPTGFLNLTDAIERSCNVYFVTQGDKLGIDGISYWMRQFGYGRTTGVGLFEVPGTVPATARVPADQQQSAAWYASIGQGPVNATPIQVASEMATIARDGIWLRPRLVPSESLVKLPTQRSDGTEIDDRRDLHLDPTALAALHAGIFRVVNAIGGTGTTVRDDALGVQVAAKTGSATASQLVRLRRDGYGKLIYDANGKPTIDRIPYGWRDAPNQQLPWYRASGVNDAGVPKGTHSWVGGYMPADRPQVAFAVYVEYGNSGGIAAGSVVKKLIAACVKEGYVTASSIPAAPTPGPVPKPPSLLARPADEPTMTEEPSGAPETD